MKKKLFLKFFVLAVIGAFVTFTSCKDYDDDISNLQSQLDKMSTTLEALKAKVDAGAVITKVENTADGVKVTLSDNTSFNLTNGKDGVAGPKGDKGDTGAEGKPGSVVTANADGFWYIDGVATDKTWKGATGPQGPAGEQGPAGKDGVYYVPNADGYWYKHDGDKEPVKGDKWLLPGVITAVMNNVGDVTFANVKSGDNTLSVTIYNNKLLRSLVLIPHYYVNGVEAIGFNPIEYVSCLSGEEMHLANPNNITVQYYVNPSSITEDMIDTDNLSFVYRLKENKFKSAAIDAVANFVSLADGILTVNVVLDANESEDYNSNVGPLSYYNIEKMDMLALQVPLSEKAANYAAGVEPVITSDWARVDLDVLENPVIDREGFLCAEDNTTYSEDFSTVAAAKAATAENDKPYVLELVYDKKYDLVDFVATTALGSACAEFNPADYGMVYNFDLLDENGNVIVYKLTQNDTDQQKFINLKDSKKGSIESKVYTTTGTDAIGRTPIVRVQLKDTATGCVVTQGFIKIKWVKEQPVHEATYPSQKVNFNCDVEKVGFGVDVEWMNVNIYNKMDTYYEEFIHNNELDDAGVYDENGVLLDWAVVIDKADSQSSTDTDLFKVHLSEICELTDATTFTGYVHYKSKMNGEVTVRIKVTLNVTMPKLDITGYNQTYWQGGNASSNQFNVNPIVYGTASQTANVTGDTNNGGATALVFTDLLNGFVDKNLKYSDDINDVVKSSIAGHTPCDVKIEFDITKLNSYFGAGKWNIAMLDGYETLYLNGIPAAQIGFNPAAVVPGAEHDGFYIGLVESDMFEGGGVPTSAAISLIGKNVPVRVVAKLCCETECKFPTTIKAYDVHFMVPLKINSDFVGEFEDGVVNGDSLSVDGAFTLTDWRDYLVANVADNTVDPGKEKQKYTESLYKYYVVQTPVWDLTKVKCNIAGSGSNLDVVPGAKNDLPANYQLAYDGTTNSLVFFNNSGTPLQKDFELYVPVSVGYKWGTLTSTVTIKVKGI